MAEVPRVENNVETEKNPEQVASDATAVLERKESLDNVSNSNWSNKAKEFVKGSSALSVLGLFAYCASTVISIYKFAVEAIKKKGEVGFGGGMKIAEETLNYKTKKTE